MSEEVAHIHRDPFGKSRFAVSWRDAVARVKRCKKNIAEFIRNGTCTTAKKVNKNYDCSEDWVDDLNEIIDSKNYFNCQEKHDFW